MVWIWEDNSELAEESREGLLIPIYKKGDKAQQKKIHLYSVGYKIFPIVLFDK